MVTPQTSTNPSSVTQRLVVLDVLRGIAILLVILVHSPTAIPDQTGILEAVFYYFKTVGWMGVDLFFVLSGFLISNLLFSELERTETIRCWRFWGRRGFKIWPSYFIAYGAMVLTWIAKDCWLKSGESLKNILWDALWNSLFIQNYVNCKRWPHSWTLAVEEHFYILLPLFLVLLFFGSLKLFRANNKFYTTLLVSIVAINVFILVSRFLNYDNINSWKYNNIISHFRFDSLLVGVAAAVVMKFNSPSKLIKRLLIGVTVLLVFSSFTLPYLRPIRTSWHCSTYGYTLFAIAFGMTILLAVLSQESPFVQWVTTSKFGRALSWIGIYSYTIYLAHSVIFALPGIESVRQIILIELKNRISSHFVINWGDRLFFWVVSILGGILLSHVVEQPFLRLRSKVLPSSSVAELPKTEPLIEYTHYETDVVQ